MATILPTGCPHRNTGACLRGTCCPASPCQGFGHSYSILTAYLNQLAVTGNKVSLPDRLRVLELLQTLEEGILSWKIQEPGGPREVSNKFHSDVGTGFFLFLSFFLFFFNHIRRANKFFSPYQARWEEHCFLYSWVGLHQRIERANSIWVIKGDIWVIWEHFVHVTELSE